MCGIAGVLNLGGPGSADELRSVTADMAESLRHRGPDDGGVWVDTSGVAALGVRRLAVLDLSDAGHQPMVSTVGDHVLAFNGEIYNFAELRTELQRGGIRFQGHSDTEVLLTAITRWGVAGALQRTNGMFGLALWDRRLRRMTLARDRLGEKPLYYARFGKTVIFGSELKALRHHPGLPMEVDREAVCLYLRHTYIPAPWSIWRHVKKLIPGTLLQINADHPTSDLTPTPYWSALDAAHAGLDNPLLSGPEEIAEAVEELLLDCVKLRMASDVPLGAFLSGGVDSSTIVALMQAVSAQPVRTFTVGFAEAAYDEAASARQVATHLGTGHTEVTLTARECQQVVPRLPEVYDEPFADSSQVPTLLVSELARRHVTVSLSGDGGDELFGGYPRYSVVAGPLARLLRVPLPIRSASAALVTRVPTTGWDRALAPVAKLLPAGLRDGRPGDRLHKLAGLLDRSDLNDAYMGAVSFWQDPSSAVIGGAEPPVPVKTFAAKAGMPEPTARFMYVDSVTYLPDDILVKVDRASMAHGLESRMPLLDHRLFELAWRIPPEFRVGTGNKPVLRRILSRHLPAGLIDRPKRGFALPVGEWLRGALRPWAEELLSDSALRAHGLVRPEPVRQLWAEHLAGSRDWKHQLWAVLMLEAWRDHWR